LEIDQVKRVRAPLPNSVLPIANIRLANDPNFIRILCEFHPRSNHVF
jgi:hypothetical protein